MPSRTSASHSQPADDLLTTVADDVAAAGGNVSRAASQPRADGGKKPAVASWRVWSEADEVRILEGLAAYAEAHGEEPRRSQLRAALDGCGLDKADFTVTEIYEKVRRLRTKYTNLRAAGGVPVPVGGAVDGDQVRKYELAMAIWGDRQLTVVKKGGTTKANANANTNAAPSTRLRRGFEELQGLYPSLALEVERITDEESLQPVVKRAFEFIGDEQARELDAKLKKQMVMEAQMTMNKTALRNKVLDTLIRLVD